MGEKGLSGAHGAGDETFEPARDEPPAPASHDDDRAWRPDHEPEPAYAADHDDDTYTGQTIAAEG